MNKWHEHVDILVIGSGFAGLTAAIQAKLLGKNVKVIEKMKKPGGNSIISDGGIAAPQTMLQKKWGVEDSEQNMYEDMLKAGRGLNHPLLLRTFVTEAASAFKWTIETLNVRYLDRVDLFGGHRVARCYTPEGRSGTTMIKKMMLKVEALGIPIEYSTKFESFIKNENGDVIGGVVLKEHDYKTESGIPVTIRTNNGIIIATGGFSADIAFRSKQDSRLDEKIETTNKPFATAEVLKDAIKIGAASVHLDHIQLGAWASPDERGFGEGPLFADYILFQYGIILDPTTGKRFFNELGDRKASADAILSKGHPCIGLADEKAVLLAGWDLSKAIEKKVVRTFESLEALATYYDLNYGALQASVNRYNAFVIKGEDDDFQKQIVKGASPIQTPPFYAMRLWPKVHFTVGGLTINERAQVLDHNGDIINGLYAAGEVVGGVHGASRLGSCAITECIVFGRIAGKNI